MMAIKKICNKSGCSSLVDSDQQYCERHKDQEQKDKRDRNRYYDTYQRDQRSKKFYNSAEWLVVRQQALIRDNYLCQDCLDEQRFTKADVGWN